MAALGICYFEKNIRRIAMNITINVSILSAYVLGENAIQIIPKIIPAISIFFGFIFCYTFLTVLLGCVGLTPAFTEIVIPTTTF
jgi:hypothetical protein